MLLKSFSFGTFLISKCGFTISNFNYAYFTRLTACKDNKFTCIIKPYMEVKKTNTYSCNFNEALLIIYEVFSF